MFNSIINLVKYKLGINQKKITSNCFEFINQILGVNNKLSIVDVGGAVNLQPHFNKFIGNAIFHIFEPDLRSFNDLIKTKERYKFYDDFNYHNIALSGRNSERILYLSNVPTGTSILRLLPDSKFIKENNSYFFPMQEMVIKTATLETFLTSLDVKQVDGIKLDVQGAEYEILKGLGEGMFNKLDLIEIEIGFYKIYEDQTDFCIVKKDLENLGFTLFDLRLSRSNLSNTIDGISYAKDYFETHDQCPSISQRLWECDAIFLRDPSYVSTHKFELNRVRKIVVMYCIYNYFSEAIQLLKHFKSDFSAKEFKQLVESVKLWNKKERSNLKNVEKALSKNNYFTWAQYMWTPSPSN